jgi:hypothetical protein
VYNKIALLLDEADSYDGKKPKLCLTLRVTNKALQMDLTVPSFFVWHGTALGLMIRRLTPVEGLWESYKVEL